MERSRTWAFAAALAVLGAACAANETETGTEAGPAETAERLQADASAAGAAQACEWAPHMALEGRASPADSVFFDVGGETVTICYGRPSSRGRVMIGGENVPYGRLWRTGANEPTRIHVPFAAEIAGVAVEPGWYSLYTIPTEAEWTVILNRSTSQWGIESAYTPEIEAQEVGRGTVPAERLDEHVETFTITGEPRGDDSAVIVLRWEHTRVEIPLVRR